MIITTKQLYELFDPWPLIVPKPTKNKWRITLVSFQELISEYVSCWDKTTKAKLLYKHALKHDFNGQRHLIHSMTRNKYIPRVIVAVDGVIWDGNHGLASLLQRKYKGSVLLAQRIKVK